MSDFITGNLAIQQTRDLALSALPGAAVVPDLEPIRPRRLRRIAALALRRLADRLEPAPRLSTESR
ncbi:MAG TPA: hypothetical protein VE442_13455 [Jatrophihabitans sp.]|jgi:hypothetical protein|nr:hypothetical protein [Jatrophihabitans sp.]